MIDVLVENIGLQFLNSHGVQLYTGDIYGGEYKVTRKIEKPAKLLDEYVVFIDCGLYVFSEFMKTQQFSTNTSRVHAQTQYNMYDVYTLALDNTTVQFVNCKTTMAKLLFDYSVDDYEQNISYKQKNALLRAIFSITPYKFDDIYNAQDVYNILDLTDVSFVSLVKKISTFDVKTQYDICISYINDILSFTSSITTTQADNLQALSYYLQTLKLFLSPKQMERIKHGLS